MAWKPSLHKIGAVICDYTPKPGADLNGLCIPIALGDLVEIREENGAWYRGRVYQSSGPWGIFPANHIQVKDHILLNKPPLPPLYAPKEDPVAREVVTVVREWGALLLKQYAIVDGRTLDGIVMILKELKELISQRKQILSGLHSAVALADLKSKMTSKIDWGNRFLELDLVPRNVKGEVIDVDHHNANVVELFRVHQLSAGKMLVSTRGSVRRKIKAPPSIANYHIIVTHDDTGLVLPDEVEVHYSLFSYDFLSNRGDYITEPFVVRQSRRDGSQIQLQTPHKCIFTDLSGDDIKLDLFLVCNIIRNGPMELSRDAKTAGFYRRPLACSVLPLKEMLSEGEERTLPYAGTFYKANEEEYFGQLPECIITRTSGKFSSFDKDRSLIGKLRLLSGSIEQIRKDPLTFEPGTCIARLRGFPDILSPTESRNDLFITLCNGDFEKGKKATPRNIEVYISAWLEDGQQLRDCFMIGVGEEMRLLTDYVSTVFYHTNAPKWRETLKVVLTPEKTMRAHLRFLFVHCSSDGKDKADKKFAFAFLPLAKRGMIVTNAEHVLPLFKYEPIYENSRGPPIYLNETAIPRFQKEIVVRTQMSSTTFTQHEQVFSLLRMRTLQTEEDIKQALHLVQFAPPPAKDVLPFLADFLDALFSILERNIEVYGQLVFQAIVVVVGIVTNDKNSSFRSTLDDYIKSRFRFLHAHHTLMLWLRVSVGAQASTQPKDEESYVKFSHVMRALEYVFKLLLRSRLCYQSTLQGPQLKADELEFQREMDGLFEVFLKFLKQPQESLVAAKSQALLNLASIFTDLTPFYPVTRLGSMGVMFLEAVDGSVQKGVVTHKLIFIQGLAKGALFMVEESRNILLPKFVSILCRHLQVETDRDLVLLTVETVGDIIAARDIIGESVTMVLQITQTLLDPILELIRKLDWQSEVTGSFLATFLALLHLMKEQHYFALLRLLQESGKLEGFVRDMLGVFRDLVSKEGAVFPTDWVTMYVLQSELLQRSFEFISLALFHYFSGANFNAELWLLSFELSVDFACQKHLQVEKFTASKRQKVVGKHDKRVRMAQHLSGMWGNLSRDAKLEFIPLLLAPFLKFSLLPDTQIRKAIVEIFFDMMVCEAESSSSFDQMENIFFQKLDELISDGWGDMEFKELFEVALMGRCQTHNNPFIKMQGPRFLSGIGRLIYLLVNLREVPDVEEHRAERASCLYDMLSFYQQLQCTGMYVNYIYKLVAVHVATNAFLEAAYTLTLHASDLQWSDKPMDFQFMSATPKAQTHRQLKMQIYTQIIEYCDKGQAWEMAIQFCKELADQYERETFEFQKLSDILTKQVRFYNNIIQSTRDEPQYYRVGYYGTAYPVNIRNKEFVYRSLKKYRITDFTEQIQAAFPNASMLPSGEAISDKHHTYEGQYIVISKLNVEPARDPDKVYPYKDKNVPKHVSSYYQQNQLRCFSYQRVYRKGPKSDNEFVNLWLELTYVTCGHSLPYVLNRSVITDIVMQELSPVETAINSLQDKYVTMCDLFAEFDTKTGQVNVNPLTMSLLGVLDAAVQGGMEKYQECFFVPQYVEQYPNEKENLVILQQSILLILEVSEFGLGIHGRLCPSDLRPLQVRMEEKLFDLKKKNGLIAQDAVFIPSERASFSSVHSSGHKSEGSSRTNSQSIKQRPNTMLSRPRLSSNEAKEREALKIQASAAFLTPQGRALRAQTVSGSTSRPVSSTSINTSLNTSITTPMNTSSTTHAAGNPFDTVLSASPPPINPFAEAARSGKTPSSSSLAVSESDVSMSSIASPAPPLYPRRVVTAMSPAVVNPFDGTADRSLAPVPETAPEANPFVRSPPAPPPRPPKSSPAQ